LGHSSKGREQPGAALVTALDPHQVKRDFGDYLAAEQRQAVLERRVSLAVQALERILHVCDNETDTDSAVEQIEGTANGALAAMGEVK
jgi:hypothetical protein